MSEQGRRFIMVRAGRRVPMVRSDGQTEILPFKRPTR